MSAGTGTRPKAAPGTRCLLLQLEPTPYILPRALYVYNDPELHTELIWTFVNSSQDWGKDAAIGNAPVLLDGRVSRLRQYGRVARLMMKILRGHYTVAHLAGWGHWVVRLAIVCCKVRGVPFSIESDTPLKTDLTSWREWLKRKTYPVLLNWATIVIPGGTRQAKLFRYYGVREEKICVSHMTVDTERLRGIRTPPRETVRAEAGIEKDDVVMLFVGRLIEKKGIDLLLHCFEHVVAKHQQLRVVVIGDGPLRTSVEVIASRYPGVVQSLGRQDQQSVVGWMRAADFLVLPSEHEPWGLVVNESMTCGLPVIVSDECGCVDDLIENGRTGLIVPARDREALLQAITRLTCDEELRIGMAREAREKIRPWVIARQAETIRAALVRMSNQR